MRSRKAASGNRRGTAGPLLVASRLGHQSATHSQQSSTRGLLRTNQTEGQGRTATATVVSKIGERGVLTPRLLPPPGGLHPRSPVLETTVSAAALIAIVA